MKTIILAFFVLSSSIGFAEVSLKRILDLSTQESKVEFLAIGKPSLMKINGSGGKLKGQIEIDHNLVTGLVNVPLSDISTGITLRDEHMKKKYLETDKFPEATLRITEFKMEKDYFKSNGSQKNIPFKGKLKIHGIEKDVIGTADLDSDDRFLQISAKTNTNITDYKIDIPSYMGIKVADDVAIKTDLKIKK
jgi:polyisoprenoid-binding protein YceI